MKGKEGEGGRERRRGEVRGLTVFVYMFQALLSGHLVNSAEEKKTTMKQTILHETFVGMVGGWYVVRVWGWWEGGMW